MTTFTNHHLTAENVNYKSGPAVMLTKQEGIDDAETITIHQWQLVDVKLWGSGSASAKN